MNTGLRCTLLSFSLVSSSIALTSVAAAQATPDAIQNLSISAFGGLTGAYTGLESTKNLSITAGADLGFRPFHRFYPSIEVRGTYPMDSGTVAGERNILFGAKVERHYRTVFRPYGTAFYGRDKIEYQNGGYPNPQGTLLYLTSISNMYSFGGGIDIDLSPHFAAKFDGQFQRYETPVTTSGVIYAKAATVGVVYRLDFNHHFRYDRRTDQVKNARKEPAPRPVPPPPPIAAPDPGVTPPDSTAPPAPDATTPPPPSDSPAPSNTPSPTPTPDPTAPAPAPTPQPQ